MRGKDDGMKYFFGALVGVTLLLIGAGIFLYTGRYNVGAIAPHSKITTWILEEARDRSIHFHSREIEAPSLKESKLVKDGFKEYHEMCRQCHGAPGRQPAEFAQGLYPKPPDLTSKEMKEFSEGELYWVVKNGIKMTGMPAFGPTHEENELWGIVAFLRNLPKLGTGEYEAMAKSAGRTREDREHRHPAVKKH